MEMEKANNGFGPVYEKRQNRSYYATILCWVLAVALRLTYHFFFGSEFSVNVLKDMMVLVDIISALLTGELIKRVLLLAEEFYHVEKRYLGSRRDAVTACLSFPDKNEIVFFLWILTSGAYIYRLKSDIPCMPLLSYLVITITLPLCIQALGLKSFSDAELSDISEKQIKNIAKGLAWSYYFGYLKLLLPKEWNSMISKAIAPDFVVEGVDMRDKLDSNKIFIVMPKDCFCYDDFEKVSKECIRFEADMPTIKITRAAVKERPYKSTLYRIQKPNERPKFVIMEYATPLFAIYDMQKSEESSFFTAKDLNNQVIIFYKTLKEILEGDPLCKDKYRLILVSAAQDDLADVIARAIEEDNNITME